MGPRPTIHRHKGVQFRLIYDADSHHFVPEVIPVDVADLQDAQRPCRFEPAPDAGAS
jgi:hypothetical protein